MSSLRWTNECTKKNFQKWKRRRTRTKNVFESNWTIKLAVRSYNEKWNANNDDDHYWMYNVHYIDNRYISFFLSFTLAIWNFSLYVRQTPPKWLWLIGLPVNIQPNEHLPDDVHKLPSNHCPFLQPDARHSQDLTTLKNDPYYRQWFPDEPIFQRQINYKLM